jgi:hypothetical protein
MLKKHWPPMNADERRFRVYRRPTLFFDVKMRPGVILFHDRSEHPAQFPALESGPLYAAMICSDDMQR